MWRVTRWAVVVFSAFLALFLVFREPARAAIPPRCPMPRVCGVIPVLNMDVYMAGLPMVWSVSPIGCLKLNAPMVRG